MPHGGAQAATSNEDASAVTDIRHLPALCDVGIKA